MAKTKPKTTAHSHSQSSANKLREKVLLLCGKEREAQLEVAEAVYELYYGTVEVGGGELPLWSFFGHKSWFDYVETEVGLHVSTAAGYRMVHDVFMIRLKGKWDQEIPLPSFTKLKALVRVVDPKTVNAWLKRANSISCCQLEEEIAEFLYGKKKAGALRHFTALLTSRQLTTVNAIIEVGRQEFPELDSRGQILTKILEQWDAAVAKKTKRGLRMIDGGKSA
jgi:hypothetical protein